RNSSTIDQNVLECRPLRPPRAPATERSLQGNDAVMRPQVGISFGTKSWMLRRSNPSLPKFALYIANLSGSLSLAKTVFQPLRCNARRTKPIPANSSTTVRSASAANDARPETLSRLSKVVVTHLSKERRMSLSQNLNTRQPELRSSLVFWKSRLTFRVSFVTQYSALLTSASCSCCDPNPRLWYW